MNRVDDTERADGEIRRALDARLARYETDTKVYHEAILRMRLALRTIAYFPITDPKNADAINMQQIARQNYEQGPFGLGE